MQENIQSLSIATIRSLCIDMTNKAKSGHPGIALGAAPILYTLYTKHLVASAKDPNWISRDRFVLSAGHGSSLLYAILHLAGYKVSIDDIKNFRQVGSITPGHPEWKVTPGVDATSGPLGQGIATGVGMAMAELMLKNTYTRGETLCDHYTYVLCGDGCLQEGISQEAISIAGFQKLNKLILLYDSNNVTLDGNLELSYNENVKMRFEACGWNVLEVKDGNDCEAIDKAICHAKKSKDKPTLIIVNTVIGYGATHQGTNKVHGAPIGIEDGARTKKEVYHFDHEDFYVPQEVYDHFKETFGARGEAAYNKYQEEFVKYHESNKVEAERFLKLKDLDVSEYLPKELPSEFKDEEVATRKVSQNALNDYALALPNLYGGSADVASSVMTQIKGGSNFTPDNRSGHTVNFGIREFAMASIQNGILLHGGLRFYVGSFLAFSDYMKAAIRMATLVKLPAIYLFSHDSIAVGEDGPTHQPVEQVATLRLFPNINVIRPCDARETYAAWQVALRSTQTPTALILSRQVLPQVNSSAEGLYKGAYVISDDPKATFIIIASGSEVILALNAQKELLAKGIHTRVVSMPSWELFERTTPEYKQEVFNLPKEKRISVEMMSSFAWDRYAEHHMAIDTYGVSGKAGEVMKYFDFTVEGLVKKVEELTNVK